LFSGGVGAPRLLRLFTKLGIKTTWYIPGHSLDTFPEQMAAVRDAGHEMWVLVERRALTLPVGCMDTRTKTPRRCLPSSSAISSRRRTTRSQSSGGARRTALSRRGG